MTHTSRQNYPRHPLVHTAGAPAPEGTGRHPRTKRPADPSLACVLMRVHYADLLRYAERCMFPTQFRMIEPGDLVLECVESLLHETACPAEESAAVRYMKGMIRLKVRKQRIRNRAAELREVHTAVEPDSPYGAAAAILQTRAVQQAIGGLPTCSCDTNTRYWIHGDTAGEIAADHGVALSTVKNQIARARPKLREALRHHATDDHDACPNS